MSDTIDNPPPVAGKPKDGISDPAASSEGNKTSTASFVPPDSTFLPGLNLLQANSAKPTAVDHTPDDPATEAQESTSPPLILPYRPPPMCKKRRAASESPERHVKSKLVNITGGTEFVTTYFTASDGSKYTSQELNALANTAEDLNAMEEGEIYTGSDRRVLRPMKRHAGLEASKWAEATADADMSGTPKTDPPKAKKTTSSATPSPVAAKKWTEKVALDLIHGPWFPAHAGPPMSSGIVAKLMIELKKRLSSGTRLSFDLDGDGANSLKRRLLKCLTKADGISPRKQVDIHTAIEDELFYLICWNRFAFPEIAQKKGEFRELFPALFPGSYVSMYSVLKADGVEVDQLDFLNPTLTASTIYKALLKRVQSKTPNSSLLHAEPVPLDTHPDFLQKRHGESRKKFNKRKKRAMEELPTPPLNLLTLAFTVENFQTALVRTIDDVRASDGRDVEKIKEAVEVLMYRLAIKEPSAFPEVFSVM